MHELNVVRVVFQSQRTTFASKSIINGRVCLFDLIELQASQSIVVVAHWLLRIELDNSKEVKVCLRQEPEFEHEHAVGKETEEVVLVDGEAFVQRLDGKGQLVAETVLAGLEEVVRWSSARASACSFKRQRPY